VPAPPKLPRCISIFVTDRHRTKVTKGPGSRATGPAMAFKLIEASQDRWRAVNAPHLIALVGDGAAFVNDIWSNDPTTTPPPRQAAA
jgi:hypothetical protein